jgi:hypothetical protein
MLVLQSCTVAQRIEHGLCIETGVQSADGSNAAISIKTEEEEIHVKEDEEPIAISSSVKEEPEVSPDISPIQRNRSIVFLWEWRK